MPSTQHELRGAMHHDMNLEFHVPKKLAQVRNTQEEYSGKVTHKNNNPRS